MTQPSETLIYQPFRGVTKNKCLQQAHNFAEHTPVASSPWVESLAVTAALVSVTSFFSANTSAPLELVFSIALMKYSLDTTVYQEMARKEEMTLKLFTPKNRRQNHLNYIHHLRSRDARF